MSSVKVVRRYSPPRSPRRNRWRASCWETSPRGSDRGSLLGKGPAHGGHLASGLPVYREGVAGPCNLWWLPFRWKIVRLGELATMKAWLSGEKTKARISSGSRASVVSPAGPDSATACAVRRACQPSAVVTGAGRRPGPRPGSSGGLRGRSPALRDRHQTSCLSRAGHGPPGYLRQVDDSAALVTHRQQ